MSGHPAGHIWLLALVLLSACADDPVRVTTDGGAPGIDAASADVRAVGNVHGGRVAILDACDPDDPAWAPTGGCAVRGDVTFAEFNALAASPLTLGFVGHPAWRNEPGYLSIEHGRPVLVSNDGGRAHSFTRVAAFGGGRVPPLNVGSPAAPECLVPPAADPTTLEPGGHTRLDGLPVGLHRFQCCFHPWMRAVIRVNERG